MSFSAIRKNKIPAKISEFTVFSLSYALNNNAMLSGAARRLKFGPSIFSKNSLLEHGLLIPSSVNDRVISLFCEGFGMFRENKTLAKFSYFTLCPAILDQTPQNAASNLGLHCLINECSVKI